MNKKKLLAIIAAKENLRSEMLEQKAELRSKSDATEDVNELRAAAAELKQLNTEIHTIEQDIADLRAAVDDIEIEENRSKPQGALNSIASYSGAAGAGGENVNNSRSAETNPHDTPEYRQAFMDYVCRGVKIPAELRADAKTTLGDVGAVIPTTLLNEIISKMSSYGNIYAKVRKMNVKGGIRVPKMSLKPTAEWVGSGAGKDQKLEANEYVEFTYFGLECKIAQELLVNIVTYDAFQREFVPLATEAITKSLDVAIIKGTGDGQPTGITIDTNVPAANIITMPASDFVKWDAWKKNVFAKMKKSYRNGLFLMAQGTFDGYIDGMVDKNGQPIGRVNYGITDGEVYRFGGKTVETVEDDVIASYDEAAAGDIIAVFFNPTDYVINSNMELTVTEWYDHDKNLKKTKAMLVCDGKLLDPNGVIIIKKG